jgi:hypothetical protein
MTAPMRPDRPILLVDVDGVISLFGPPAGPRPDQTAGTWHQVEGIAHLLSARAAAHLHDLAADFELVWCTGWEERANEHLPHLLGLPVLPVLSFDRSVGRANAHWKLAAIDAYAGPTRPLAWVDDALDARCHAWARERPGPTLLVPTLPHVGLGGPEAATLHAFAAGLAARG